MPFSVAVLDMDWHRVDIVPARYGSGWTGYSWKPRALPRPARPSSPSCTSAACGSRSTSTRPTACARFEDAYPAMAEALGRDPATERADRLRHHRPRVPRGLPRGAAPPARGRRASTSGGSTGSRARHSRIAGIDPLWMLNHFHFLDSGRDGPRPLTFSRYAGPGSHRYPVGFSGDTVITLGVAGLPAGLHRDRVEHRLRLVEPRHRRPHVRRRATTSWPPAGCSSASSRRSCGCTREPTRSSPRSRGGSRARRAPRWATPAAAAPAACRTCTR